MENIIDDLLILSRVRSIHKKMVMEDFPLHEAVRRVVEKYIPAAQGKKIRMELAGMPTVTLTSASGSTVNRVKERPSRFYSLSPKM